MKRVMPDTNVYEFILRFVEKNVFEQAVVGGRLVFYGNNLIRKELREIPKVEQQMIGGKMKSLRNALLSLYDLMVGRHGDHVGGELEAFRCLERNEAEACVMLDLNWETWTRDGTIDPRVYEIKSSTEQFDHCVFTARETVGSDAERRWLEALHSMQYANPEHRQMMDLEGLKAWMPGRTSGFGPLTAAVEAGRFFDSST